MVANKAGKNFQIFVPISRNETFTKKQIFDHGAVKRLMLFMLHF